MKKIVDELHTLRDMVRWGTTQLQKAQVYFGHGFDNAWDEALFLALHVLHLSSQDATKAADARLLIDEKIAIADLYQRRIDERKPAAYLVQEAWFADLAFYVNEKVIIPRSPMAELIEQQFVPYVDPDQVHAILDLCTGSGCIAIACARAFPEAEITGVDISPEALAIAEINRQRHQLTQSVQLLQSDLFSNIPQQARYDIIISNPPYVSHQELAELAPEYRHEPQLSLDGGHDGLALIRPMIEKAASFLTPNGILIVEVGNRANSLMEQFPHLPFLWLEFARGGHGVFLLTQQQLKEYANLS